MKLANVILCMFTVFLQVGCASKRHSSHESAKAGTESATPSGEKDASASNHKDHRIAGAAYTIFSIPLAAVAFPLILYQWIFDPIKC